MSDILQFGDNIRAYRKAAGITQKQLADLVGVSRSSIANYERNAVVPPADIMQSIMRAVGIPGLFFYFDDLGNAVFVSGNGNGSRHDETFLEKYVSAIALSAGYFFDKTSDSEYLISRGEEKHIISAEAMAKFWNASSEHAIIEFKRMLAAADPDGANKEI